MLICSRHIPVSKCHTIDKSAMFKRSGECVKHMFFLTFSWVLEPFFLISHATKCNFYFTISGLDTQNQFHCDISGAQKELAGIFNIVYYTDLAPYGSRYTHTHIELCIELYCLKMYAVHIFHLTFIAIDSNSIAIDFDSYSIPLSISIFNLDFSLSLSLSHTHILLSLLLNMRLCLPPSSFKHILNA